MHSNQPDLINLFNSPKKTDPEPDPMSNMITFPKTSPNLNAAQLDHHKVLTVTLEGRTNANLSNLQIMLDRIYAELEKISTLETRSSQEVLEALI